MVFFGVGVGAGVGVGVGMGIGIGMGIDVGMGIDTVDVGAGLMNEMFHEIVIQSHPLSQY